MRYGQPAMVKTMIPTEPMPDLVVKLIVGFYGTMLMLLLLPLFGVVVFFIALGGIWAFDRLIQLMGSISNKMVPNDK